MEPSELLNHPRYGRDPAFFFVEQLVVDTVEGLAADTQQWIAATLQTEVANWRDRVKVLAQLSETFEVAILDSLVQEL